MLWQILPPYPDCLWDLTLNGFHANKLSSPRYPLTFASADLVLLLIRECESKPFYLG
jgi:hypothetical protein